MINKNRDRENPTFANINLLGKCNANCYFCLGKDIEDLLSKHDQTQVHYTQWENFGKFLKLCKENDINKLYITGQNTDSLMYKYLFDLIQHLQSDLGFSVGLRTNGILAEKQISAITICKDEIGYSVNGLYSRDAIVKSMGVYATPDWDYLFKNTPNCRVSIVVNRYNVQEFFNIVKFVSKYENVKYIQARRIATDTRYDLLKEDIEVYENLFKYVDSIYDKTGDFYLAQQYNIFGKEVNFWRTVETSVNSFNYFTDGTISEKYFIVEGYLDQQGELTCKK